MSGWSLTGSVECAKMFLDSRDRRRARTSKKGEAVTHPLNTKLCVRSRGASSPQKTKGGGNNCSARCGAKFGRAEFSLSNRPHSG